MIVIALVRFVHFVLCRVVFPSYTSCIKYQTIVIRYLNEIISV